MYREHLARTTAVCLIVVVLAFGAYFFNKDVTYSKRGTGTQSAQKQSLDAPDPKKDVKFPPSGADESPYAQRPTVWVDDEKVSYGYMV